MRGRHGGRARGQYQGRGRNPGRGVSKRTPVGANEADWTFTGKSLREKVYVP